MSRYLTAADLLPLEHYARERAAMQRYWLSTPIQPNGRCADGWHRSAGLHTARGADAADAARRLVAGSGVVLIAASDVLCVNQS